MRALDNGPSAAYGRVMKSDAVDKKSTERSGYIVVVLQIHSNL